MHKKQYIGIYNVITEFNGVINKAVGVVSDN